MDLQERPQSANEQGVSQEELSLAYEENFEALPTSVIQSQKSPAFCSDQRELDQELIIDCQYGALCLPPVLQDEPEGNNEQDQTQFTCNDLQEYQNQQFDEEVAIGIDPGKKTDQKDSFHRPDTEESNDDESRSQHNQITQVSQQFFNDLQEYQNQQFDEEDAIRIDPPNATDQKDHMPNIDEKENRSQDNQMISILEEKYNQTKEQLDNLKKDYDQLKLEQQSCNNRYNKILQSQEKSVLEQYNQVQLQLTNLQQTQQERDSYKDKYETAQGQVKILNFNIKKLSEQMIREQNEKNQQYQQYEMKIASLQDNLMHSERAYILSKTILSKIIKEEHLYELEEACEWDQCRMSYCVPNFTIKDRKVFYSKKDSHKSQCYTQLMKNSQMNNQQGLTGPNMQNSINRYQPDLQQQIPMSQQAPRSFYQANLDNNNIFNRTGLESAFNNIQQSPSIQSNQSAKYQQSQAVRPSNPNSQSIQNLSIKGLPAISNNNIFHK